MSKPKKAKMGAARLHAYAEQLQADYEQAVLDKRRFVSWVELNGRVVPKECLAKMELKVGMAEEAISHFEKVARQHGIELTEPEVEE